MAPENQRPLECFPDTYEFGRINEGLHVAEFDLVNTTNKTLRIKRLRKTCDCTNASIKSVEIKPHAKEVLSITWNTVGLSGNASTTINLHYLNESTPEVTHVSILTITGNIEKKFTAPTLR